MQCLLSAIIDGRLPAPLLESLDQVRDGDHVSRGHHDVLHVGERVGVLPDLVLVGFHAVEEVVLERKDMAIYACNLYLLSLKHETGVFFTFIYSGH